MFKFEKCMLKLKMCVVMSICKNNGYGIWFCSIFKRSKVLKSWSYYKAFRNWISKNILQIFSLKKSDIFFYLTPLSIKLHNLHYNNLSKRWFRGRNHVTRSWTNRRTSRFNFNFKNWYYQERMYVLMKNVKCYNWIQTTVLLLTYLE